ncbi:MAG: hypothetical protein EX271_11455 [Acidimicrobiales bacterium]|nr:hypothetical protein [Hyphomonadaceae bacterium]RZV37680.1 MAG: hypothetical protein EX271_11455 [Acidimicrobiales bacterium]
MLAMDVVDTLRHETKLLARDLSVEDREQQLIERLREIYKAQGIEVPDSILREGVQALDDHRFAYVPQKDSFFAKAYINRGKWGKPLILLFGILGMAWGVNYAAFEAPKNAAANRLERQLKIEIPRSLETARDDAISIAKTAEIQERVNALYNDGLAAAKSGKVDEAKRIERALTTLNMDLNQAYTLRIVSRPDELSGAWRYSEDNTDIKNYYLIVEGLDASGKPVTVNITSEEDQTAKRTTIWGVRVPESVFNRVAADKKDDQIIQNAVIGAKKRGFLNPEYNIETSGGLILEW